MSKGFRIWNSDTINDSMQHVIQLKELIEEVCIKEQVNPIDLPHSVVPTVMLYDIAACYDAMYEMLLKHDLVKAGYPKTYTKETH